MINEEFTQGTTAPNGWILSGGTGRWEVTGHGQGRSVTVDGNGDDMSYWRRPVPELKPNTAYRIRFWAKIAPGSSAMTIIGGLDSCNRDFAAATEWEPYTFVFTTPDDVSRSFLRLGQWHLKGTLFLSDVTVAPVQPVYAKSGELTLASGERMQGNTYSFAAPLAEEGSDSARSLFSHTAAFNTNRWVFTGGSEVVYRHAVPAAQQTDASLMVNVGHYTQGDCVIAASRDGHEWIEVARLKGAGQQKVELPAGMFPASEVWVRIRGTSSLLAAGNSDPGAFQIVSYEYQARLNAASKDAEGLTRYLEVTLQVSRVTVRVDDLGSLGAVPSDAVRLTLRPAPGVAGETTTTLTLGGRGDPQSATAITRVGDIPGQDSTVIIPYRVGTSGDMRLSVTVTLMTEKRMELVYSASADSFVPEYFTQNFGYRLSPAPGTDLWWCEATYKIAPSRSVPDTFSDGISMSAAGRERAAFQIVLRPKADIGPVRVSVTDMRGPGTAFIQGTAVQFLKVVYVKITSPTDGIGVAAEWPDPLQPIVGSWNPEPGKNNVLWCTVTVPANAHAGDYQGSILLQTAAGDQSVSLRLHVWGFSLPEKTALRSGFGIFPQNLRDYHDLRSDSAMKNVWDMYMKDFALHRFSPLDPLALAPVTISVTRTPNLHVTLDFRDFDIAAHRYLDEMGFNSFVINVQGLGGGRSSNHEMGSFAGFAPGTPEYDELMRQYGQQLQDHLEQNNWLSKAYVYWYDEPGTNDYPFAVQGMERLHKYAPKLKRMLTAPVEPPLEGNVDLWCPVTPDFSPEASKARQKQGEEVWWYICNRPTEPFVGLFIDHPAIELRMWLWQTWKYGVQGILVWGTNWWTSPPRFKDQLQDPWRDPMSYADDPLDVLGNGDGRFFYPPNRNPNEKLMNEDVTGPVDSMRWELLGEGEEDWEYFNVLAGIVQKAEAKGDHSPLVQRGKELLSIPEDICRDMTHYTTDPRLLYHYRAQVARAIEALILRQ